MLDTPTVSRVERRRDATKAEILEAAWQVAAEKGLAGLTLQDVARRVGMRAPSLYSYFDSKHAIYDSMFADGYRALLADRQSLPALDSSQPREAAIVWVTGFLTFCRANVPRYQLLFQRTIPGFEPSAESYQVAVQAYEGMREIVARFGLTTQRSLDLLTALTSGMANQQIANDPQGDRWMRLIPDAVDMLLAALSKGRTT